MTPSRLLDQDIKWPTCLLNRQLDGNVDCKPACCLQEVVRASNAVMLVVSPRVLWYIKMGAFDKQDMPAYAVSSVAALVGLFVGHQIACRVRQRTFNHLLIGMLVASTIMLFVGGSVGLESELHAHAAGSGGA